MGNRYEPTMHPHAVAVGGNRNQDAVWPIAMIEMLKTLHSENMSSSMIAANINSDRRWQALPRKSRNAIIGKLNRLGLSLYGRPTTMRALAGQNRTSKPISWNTQTDEIIRAMAAQGHRSGVIAAAITEQCNMVVSVQNVRFRREALGVPSAVSPRLAVAPRINERLSRAKSPSQFSMTRFKYTDAAPMVLADEPTESAAHKETGRELMLRDVTRSEATCMYPTNADVRNLKVCGDPVRCGAYCAKHAKLAYVRLPTEKRNRSFHRANEFDIGQLESI